MIIHKVTQGSTAWHALRKEHRNASEAPAIFGASKFTTRNELIHQKSTGTVKEVDGATQRRFDAGHATEALARVILEKRLNQVLYPVVMTSGNLLASVDGITMDESTLFEHKLLNKDVVAMIAAGELSPTYYWQLEQQLLVTGAEKVLFVCSDGTEDNFHMMEYRRVPGRAEELIAAWKQFDADLAVYIPARSAVEAVGKAPETLPALRIEVTGMVTASNLAEFRQTALDIIDSVNAELETDQDFADAEKAVKWCGDVETRLKAAKQHALSQTASIDELFRTIDAITEEAKQKRLSLARLIDSRKTAIREDIVMAAAKALHEYIEALNVTLGGKVRLPSMPADFAGAIKGKKTNDSLRNAADTELARAKIAASTLADHLLINLTTLREKSKGVEFLFSDTAALVAKPADDLVSTITARIADHVRFEADKAEAERERIRTQEAARLIAEQQTAAPPVAQPEPVQPVVVAQHPARQTPVNIAASAKPDRPTDAAILGALADAFDVSQGEAYRWIEDMIMSTQATAG
jgi:putative phage-type endonuclease